MKPNWYINNKTTTVGAKIEFVTLQYGLHQITIEPTHILDNSSSCIDLIFTSQANLVLDSGVHLYLYPDCHHQIEYAKFNLKIHFSVPYKREYDITGKETMELSEEQFMNLIGREH